MKIFNCDHSLIGNCFICRWSRKELSPLQMFLLIAAFFGGLISAVAFWR